MRKNNGVTLIALAVTIIVLLIIATVSIQPLLGDSGIINSANEAKTNFSLAEERDILNTCVAASMGASTRGKVEYDILKKYCNENIGLENKAYKIELDIMYDGYFFITFLASGNVYTVKENGDIIYGRAQ